MRYNILLIAIIFSMSSLSGCTSISYPEAKPLPDITFEHMDKIPVNVSIINYKDYSGDLAIQHFQIQRKSVVATKEYNLDEKIRNHLSNYVSSRFVPVSNNGELQFILQDLKIEKEFIEDKNKFKRYMEIGKIEKTEVTIKILMRHIDAYGNENKGSVLTINRYISFAASLSLADREKEMFSILDKMMIDIDQAVIKSINQTLGLSSVPIDNAPVYLNYEAINDQAHKDAVRIIP